MVMELKVVLNIVGMFIWGIRNSYGHSKCQDAPKAWRNCANSRIDDSFPVSCASVVAFVCYLNIRCWQYWLFAL